MSKNPFDFSEELYEYVKSVSLRESEQLRLLREVTEKMELANMQISPDQGQFMAMLVKLMNAKCIVEVGTFTGYSALAMAQALPDDGRLIACDISREWTRIGQPFWEQAGVADRIDLRIGPALDTMDELLDEGLAGTVDLIFIDADKGNYQHYYQRGIELLKTNGLIVVDNVFWDGAVIDDQNQKEDTVSIRNMNRIIFRDQRVDISMIAIGDGLFLARKSEERISD